MIILFRGISGGGKSSLAKAFCNNNLQMMTPVIDYMRQLRSIARSDRHIIFSADDYFMIDGEYKFDPRDLNKAHQKCLIKFTEEIRKNGEDSCVLLVDNTNCSIAECSPYMALAGAYSHSLSVVTLISNPIDAFKRNKHNVPFDTIFRQSLTLNDSVSNWPGWYPQKIFNS